MILWMIYAILVATLVAFGALAAERVARAFRTATRWVWVAAVALSIGLAMRTPPVAFEVDVSNFGYAANDIGNAGGVRSAGWMSMVWSRVESSARWLDVARAVQSTGMSELGRIDDKTAAVVWIGLSAFLGLAFFVVHRRLARAHAHWPRAELHGVAVRVSPRVGPVAIGVLRPEIVVPAWLLGRSETEQRMAIAHESAHTRARDPQLLGAAWIALILFPWNPAIWVMVSRLRLAIEIDCDRRVLRQGASASAYGSLLVTVAELASPLRPSALALADDSSHLTRRILAMDVHAPRFPRARAAISGVVGAVALLAACEAKEPTAADVDSMSVASAEKTAQQLGVLPTNIGHATYVVDSVRVSAETARRIGGDDIVSLKVRRTPSDTSEIAITTRHGGAAKVSPNREPRFVRDSVLVNAVASSAKQLKPRSDSVVFFVDGVRTNYATLQQTLLTLPRDRIESVEVIKGPAAEALYGIGSGQGVVSVHTKAASPSK